MPTLKNDFTFKQILLLFFVIFLTACNNSPQFDTLTYNEDYTLITSPDGRSWHIAYESDRISTYDGIVRHNSRWMDQSAPFMSNDVLVTTREFADPDITTTFVFDHKFFYKTNRDITGRINLIHALPANQEVFDMLQQIKKWDHVIIHGREVFIVDKYDENGKHLGYFKDMGCNTLLVTDVIILDAPEATP
jgi:hypothetical protein